MIKLISCAICNKDVKILTKQHLCSVYCKNVQYMLKLDINNPITIVSEFI
jgi:hypothetical protein